MKISKLQLEQIIKEEVQAALKEAQSVGAIGGSGALAVGDLLNKLGFTGRTVRTLKKLGIGSKAAIEFTTILETAISKGLPDIIEKEGQLAAQQMIMKFTNSVVQSGNLVKVIRVVNKAAVPVAVLFAMKDIYDISVAWHKYTKVAGKTKNIRAFGALRKIEKEIEKGEYGKGFFFDAARTPEGHLKVNSTNNNLMNVLAKALKANPNALGFFPTVVKQLRPDYQKRIKKTAEKYKRLAKG